MKETPNLFITLTLHGKQSNYATFIPFNGEVNIENLLDEANLLVENFLETALRKGIEKGE